MTDFKILPCAKRWNYPSVDLTARIVRTCVRGFGPVVGKEDLEKYGTDIFLNHPYMKNGRKLMLEGKFQWDCRGCYEYAKTGALGFRTSLEETVSLLAPDYQETPEQFAKNISCSGADSKYLESHTVKELEVGFGNLCDMKCIYCTSDWSSMIEAEEREHGEHKNAYYRTSIEENSDFVNAFWKWMEETALKTVETLHLIGGETLFNKYFYVFMEKLDALYRSQHLSHKIIVNIFTNLNNEGSIQKLLKVLKTNHPNIVLNLNFSNESLGPRAEFIRNGLSWERAQRNIGTLFSEGKVVLSFAPSFNNLSLSTALEYLRFIRDYSARVGQPVFVGDNNISHPGWLSPHILTEDFIPYTEEVRQFLKSEGEKFLTPDSVTNLLNLFRSFEEGIRANNHLSDDEALKKERRWFYRSIMDLQKRRDLHFSQTFPEYKGFLLKCKEAYFPA